MGILNVTPDSFSDGGKFLSIDKACEQACSLMSQGADLIDIGGQSTRPGAQDIPLDEELNRVIPIIKKSGLFQIFVYRLIQISLKSWRRL